MSHTSWPHGRVCRGIFWSHTNMSFSHTAKSLLLLNCVILSHGVSELYGLPTQSCISVTRACVSATKSRASATRMCLSFTQPCRPVTRSRHSHTAWPHDCVVLFCSLLSSICKLTCFGPWVIHCSLSLCNSVWNIIIVRGWPRKGVLLLEFIYATNLYDLIFLFV